MSLETCSASRGSHGESGMVSSGLNLWLELKDPAAMPELLFKILEQRDAINRALNDLHYVHFARFVPTPDSAALQVITSFDGELSAYVLDFVLALGDQFEMILSYVKDRPPSRVKDHPAQFLEFIVNHDLGYGQMGGGGIALYSAYPQHTVIDIIGASGLAPKCVDPQEVTVHREDVQANILRSVGASHGWHVGLRIGSADSARVLLDELLTGRNDSPQISNDATRPRGVARPRYALTVGFSYAGLLVLGISESDQKAFDCAHRAFVDGPDKRSTAAAVGDIGSSEPAYWQLGGSYPVDMFISLYADQAEEIEKQSERVLSRCQRHGLSVVNRPWSAQLLHDDGKPGRHVVHFGYVDGLSQPDLAIAGAPPREPDMQPRAAVGEFLLGANYPNVFDGRDSLGGLSPALAENATFAAVRIMEQGVVEFETMLAKASAAHNVDREWLAGKLMGRWRDGTPLEQSPDRPLPEPGAPARNQFDYLPSVDHPSNIDDSAGLRCPMGAHIRRMNPRSAIVAGRPHSRRLLRRGMPYGPKYEAGQVDDTHARGLVGMFLCADLHRQYEFILRQWAQGDRATTGIVGQQDPIIGAQDSLPDGSPMSGQFRIGQDGKPDIVLDMPRLVKTVGSIYLLMPGLNGLRYLASLGGAHRNLHTPILPPFSAQLCSWLEARAKPDESKQVPAPDPKTFDPRAREFREDPFTTYAWFRTHHPIVELPLMKSIWAFSHEHVRKIANDQKRFRKRNRDDTSPAGLLNMDPPPHTGCRAHIEPLFDTVLQAIAPSIKDTVDKCYIANCKGKSQVRPLDWMSQFAQPVARAVFLNLFGLLPDHAPWFIKEVEDILALATPAADRRPRDEIGEKLLKLGLRLALATKFSRPTPGRLFDRILEMDVVYDEKSNKGRFGLSGKEVEQISQAITFGMTGILPLQWFIALATWRLLENQGALLQQIKDDATITNRDIIDELLRFDMSPPLSDRYVIADTSIDGIQLVKDQRLTLAFASANRDKVEFGSDADTINFKRGKGPGWAFGDAGEHSCLGRQLVYKVMDPVIETLRNAMPVPRLAADFVPTWGTPSSHAMFRAMTALLVHC